MMDKNKTHEYEPMIETLDRELKMTNNLYQSLLDSKKEDDNKQKRIQESIRKIITGNTFEQFSIKEISAEI